MKVIVFGATGMVGQGVLRECLRDGDVTEVLTVGRSATGQQHPKLRELVHKDFLDFSAVEKDITGYDACFFCLGVTFVYVTGASTDSTEQGRMMWARVKGKTENDLLKLPFKAAFMFRPGAIQPLHGVRSKTAWVQALYVMTGPLLSFLHQVAPNYVTTTEELGRAMLSVAKRGYPKPILEMEDIHKAGA